MSRNINDFVSKMGSRVYPFARPNSFVAQFITPSIFDPKESRNFALNVKTAEFPGKQIGTAEIKHNGPFRKFPNAKIFSDLTLSFYVTDDFRERVFFEDWMDDVASPVDHTFGFYDDYAARNILKLSSLNMLGKVSYTVEFKEIYPINLAPISLDYGENDSVMLMSVTLAYRLWERTFAEI